MSLRHCPLHNRVQAVMIHTSRYSTDGLQRLSDDTGIHVSALYRAFSGRTSPSFALIFKVNKALEKALGRLIGPGELFSVDGCYPTPSVCTLVGCPGCLPDQFYNAKSEIKPQYEHIRPGEWSLRGVPHELIK